MKKTTGIVLNLRLWKLKANHLDLPLNDFYQWVFKIETLFGMNVVHQSWSKLKNKNTNEELMVAHSGLSLCLKQDQDEEVRNLSIALPQLNQSKSMLTEWTQNEKMSLESSKRKKWKSVVVMSGKIKSQFQKLLSYLIPENDNSFRIFEILIKRNTQSQRFWIKI